MNNTTEHDFASNVGGIPLSLCQSHCCSLSASVHLALPGSHFVSVRNDNQWAYRESSMVSPSWKTEEGWDLLFMKRVVSVSSEGFEMYLSLGLKRPPPHTGGPIVQCDFHPAGIPATASWKSAYPVALAICRSRWYLPWKREGIMENSWGLSPRRGQESLWVKGTLETSRCIRSPQLQ